MAKIPDIAPFKEKLAELDTQMSDPNFYSDQRHAAEVSREHQHVSGLIEKFEAFHATQSQIIDNQSLLDDSELEEDLRVMAAEEVESLKEQLQQLETAVLRAMIPPDPTDSRNSVMEIRGGAGGDEANIFAGDLYRMYSRYAETKGWRVSL